ncbi:MAG: phage major capsid protein [Gammaproteobacteria bacterium]|nr:phage major capsid protein [Gammaproteobacteria bacterium]
MKHRIKLLKDWKDPNGTEWKAGQVIEIDNKTVAGELIVDGFGVKDTSEEIKSIEQMDGKISETVSKAIDSKMEDISQKTAEKLHAISVKDCSDSDPSHGYIPEKKGDKFSKSELQYGLGQFAADLYNAGESMVAASPRLKKSIERSKDVRTKAAGSGLTVAADDSVGALIPPVLNTMLLDVAEETAVIRPRASVMPVSTMSTVLTQMSDYDRSSGLVYGGCIAYWKGENAELTASAPKIEEIGVNLHALTILSYVSHQAMRFAPFDMGGYLLPKMASAITFKEEDAFINGTGAGMPMGILNAGAKISITAETGQSSTANIIVAKNIDKMYAQLLVEKQASVAWMYSRPELYVWLVNLSRTVGTGGQLAMLYQPSNVVNGTQSALNGLPCIDLEHMPAAATTGDLTLVDWSQYLIADDRSGPEVAQSMHLKFDYGQNAYRIMKYVDGRMTKTTTKKRHKGSNYLAPVVVIATRS